MDPTRTVGATERTQDAGRTDEHMDGRTVRWTDGRSETNISPQQLRCAGGGGGGGGGGGYDYLSIPPELQQCNRWSLRMHK